VHEANQVRPPNADLQPSSCSPKLVASLEEARVTVQMAIVAIAALCALGPASAFAQGPSGGATRFTDWNARIVASLGLDGRQQAALLAYEAKLTDMPGQSPAPSAEQFRALSLPQRLDYMADHMALDVSGLRARADAARRFYALLTPAQRTQFDEATEVERTNPGLAAAPTPLSAPSDLNYALPSHTNPDWMVKPTADELSRVYLTLASRNGVTGEAVLQCTADEDGYLADCVVNSETPAGAGFGNAALEMTAYMRMRPATNYGVPVSSAVIVPLHFAIPDKDVAPEGQGP
jgi:TonB family protein